MLSIKAIILALAALGHATPVSKATSLDVTAIAPVDSKVGWHVPTAYDLAVMASNDSFASTEAGLPISLNSIVARQSGVYRTGTARVGNGDPHQNPYQQQVTQSLRCGPGGGCSVSISHSHSISWTASANAAYGWISGGFSVSESYSTGRTYTCNGNAGGDVCIWYSYGVTAYTVRSTQCYYYNGQASMCRDLGTRVLFSPNNCQQGSPYCVRGSACRSENQGYYVTANAPAGGPPC
ncbi:hypothetical protein Slin14017_G117920 [Septoria linicola]|nr:hypothetical protein Slin14017_G117920 [Septoria linicola]